MRFSTFIFRNVLRRPIRTTLTMSGMAVAVAAVVALVGLADGLGHSMLKLYVDRGVSLIVTRKDAVNALSSVLPAKVATDIGQLDGVAATCAGLVEFMAIDECGRDPIGVQGWPAGNYMFDQLKITDGAKLPISDPSPESKEHASGEQAVKSVVVGNTLARIKSLKVGETITVSEEKFRIAGIFESDQDVENAMVVMHLSDLQMVVGKSGKMTGCTVTAKDAKPATVAAIRAQIEGPIAASCKLSGILVAETPEEFVQKNNQVRMVSGFAWMTSWVALIIGGIGVLNTMFMSVFERTREIGILRAIGWRPQRVMHMILMESVILSIGGGVIGTSAGLGLIGLLSRFPAVNGIVHAAITPTIVIEGFAIAILVGVAGALYPAYRGSCLLPTEALRHE